MLQLELYQSAFPRRDRLRFLAQQLVIEFLEPLRDACETDEDDFFVVRLIERARSAAGDGPTLRGNDLSITAHIRQTIEQVRAAEQALRVNLSESFKGRLNDALCEFENVGSSQSCEDCLKDGFCDGLIVPGDQQGGVEPLCLKRLSEILKKTARFTEELYNRHLSGLTLAANIVVHFTHEPDDANRITGVTDFIRPPTGLDMSGRTCPSWIQIGLPLAKLARENYDPLVYVLAHELAVHSVQESLRNDARSHPKVKVAFAEGLIDSVVYEEIRLDRSFAPPLQGQVLDAVNQFHGTRRVQPGAQKSLAEHIGLGSRAYQALRKIARYRYRNEVDSMGGTVFEQTACDWSHRVALTLNLLPIDENQRHEIVRALLQLELEFGNAENQSLGLDAPEGSLLWRWVLAAEAICETAGAEQLAHFARLTREAITY